MPTKKKQLFYYWRVRASKILHLDPVTHLCHYYRRRATPATRTTLKLRTDHVCDECQRQKRILRRKK